MTLTLEELKERLIENYDPDDMVDALQISTEELLNAFEDKIINFRYKFEEEDSQYE